MKLKFIITIFLAIILSEFSFAKFYEKGDSLNVWAVSGLNMREGPGTDFPKIKKLEYGEKVEVIDQYLRSTPLNITIVKKGKKSDEFILKGFWVRVKIGMQEGYVFDGYLSRLPVLKIEKYKEPNGTITWEGEDVLLYLKKHFTLTKEEKIETNNGDGKNHSYFFEKDVKYTSMIGKCAGSNFILPNASKNEAFLFFNITWELEFWIKNKQKHGAEIKVISISEEEFKISINNSECLFILNFKNKKAEFIGDCCC